ncbi:MAG: ankyrin repeat domain-containing protein [Wolbachia sp.]
MLSLHSAVKSNYERLAKFLIGKNANVNVMAMNGYTPLHFAAVNGNRNIVNFNTV